MNIINGWNESKLSSCDVVTPSPNVVPMFEKDQTVTKSKKYKSHDKFIETVSWLIEQRFRIVMEKVPTAVVASIDKSSNKCGLLVNDQISLVNETLDKNVNISNTEHLPSDKNMENRTTDDYDEWM